MTAGTVLSRATGVIRLAVFAAVFGIAESRLPDTYNLANTFPNILYELVLGGVVTSIFVPLFIELLEKEERERAWQVISAILTVSLIGLTVISLIGVLAAPAIARFYAGRLEGPDYELQVEAITLLLRLFLPQIVLYGVYFITSGILNAHKRFGPQMWTPIVNNLVLIGVFIYFQQVYGAVTLSSITDTQLLIIGLGTTASVAPMGLLLVPYLRKLGRIRFTVALRHPSVTKLAKLGVFVIGFVVANQAGYIVIQWLANKQQGAYSVYISAMTFFLMPIGLFVWSITTALVPSLSEHATNGRWEEFKDQVAVGIRALVFLMLPAALGYLVLGGLIVRLLLQHGLATEASSELVTDVLRLFVLGLVQFSVFQLFVRAFYAMQNTRTPFFVNGVVVIVNVALAIPMFLWFEVRGIAAAQAIANTVGMIVLGAILARKLGGFTDSALGVATGRIAVAAAGMTILVGGGLYAAERIFEAPGFVGRLVVLAVLVTVGAGAYLGLAHLANVRELDYVRSLVRRRGAGPGEAPT